MRDLASWVSTLTNLLYLDPSWVIFLLAQAASNAVKNPSTSSGQKGGKVWEMALTSTAATAGATAATAATAAAAKSAGGTTAAAGGGGGATAANASVIMSLSSWICSGVNSGILGTSNNHFFLSLKFSRNASTFGVTSVAAAE